MKDVPVQKTRPQAPFRSSAGGFFSAFSGVGLLAATLLAGPVGVARAEEAPPVAAGAAPVHPATAGGKPSAALPTRQADLVRKLAKAANDSEAAGLRAELETLRTHALRPATMLLLRRATRELGDEQKPGDAVEDLGAALALQGDVGVLWRLRAQARLAAGDTDGAISDLGVALQHDADDALNWQVLTAAEEARGDGPAALKAWQHVIALDPQFPGAGKRLEKLQLKAFGQPT